MLAGKNSDLTETAETLYQLNAEEDIRLQCQAREDYYMFKTMTENKIAQLETDKNAAIANLDAAIADRDAANAVIADQNAVIAELTEKIRQLETKH